MGNEHENVGTVVGLNQLLNNSPAATITCKTNPAPVEIGEDPETDSERRVVI
jgi:hypothetical protein